MIFYSGSLADVKKTIIAKIDGNSKLNFSL